MNDFCKEFIPAWLQSSLLSPNLFEQESSKLTLAKKRRKATWNDDFCAKVLFP